MAIFIVNYNGLSTLGNIFFKCLEQFTYVSEKYAIVDLWFVDNGSSDASVNEAKKQYGDTFNYISLSHNLGYGTACNIAYRYTKKLGLRYKYYVCSNNDIELNSEAFGKLLTWLAVLEEKYPQGFIASPILVNGYDNFVDYGGYFLDDAGNTWPLRLLILNVENVEKILRDPIEVSYADGAFLIAHRNAIEDVGLFNEYFILYYEDVEFSLRAWSKGYPSILIPTVLGKHYRSITTRKASMKALYLYLRNRAFTTIQYLGPASFLKMIMWYLFYIVRVFEFRNNKQLYNIVTKMMPGHITLESSIETLLESFKFVVRAFIDGISLHSTKGITYSSKKVGGKALLSVGFSEIISQKRAIATLQRELKTYIIERLTEFKALTK